MQLLADLDRFSPVANKMRSLECLFFWLVTPLSLVSVASAGSSQHHDAVVVMWEEEIPRMDPPDAAATKKPIQHHFHTLWDGIAKNKQLRRWVRPTSSTGSEPLVPPPMEEEPAAHPLRTDEWELNLRWRKKSKRSTTVPQQGKLSGGAAMQLVGESSLHLAFAPNGYVRCHPSPPSSSSSSSSSEQEQVSSQHPSLIGTWELTPTGLVWNIDMDGNLCEFRADLHVNPFGSHPRLTRGIVLQDTTPPRRCLAGWFRPVVATFTGSGIGHDAADLSYETRNHRRRTIRDW